MDERKDFKSVKVNIKGGARNQNTLSRSMLYSGINIFGQLTQMYLQNKEEFGTAASAATGGGGASAGESSGDMMNLGPEVLLMFKRVQKKDPITKCKALEEISQYIKAMNNKSQEYKNLLTFFLYHYCRIMVNESDKKVREATQNTLGGFIKKETEALVEHIDKVFPIWYCSFFDSSPEVAKAGQRNWTVAFKDNADDVFKMSFKYFLHFADEHLRQTEDQLSEGSVDSSKVLKEEQYDRIISAILQALADSFKFTEKSSEEDKAYYYKKLVSYLDLKKAPKVAKEADAAPAIEVQDQIVSASRAKPKKAAKGADKDQQTKLWLFMTQKYRGKVRSSCMLFVSKFLQNLPKDVTEAHVAQLAPLIFDMVQEDNPIIQNILWKEAYFTLGKQFPEVWTMVSLKKSFIPGILACLKNCGFGASFSVYPNLVKFLSVFPMFHLVDFKDDKNNKFALKDRAKFLTQFYQHLFAGLKSDEACNFHRELTGAYFETLTFFLIKRFVPFLTTKDFKFDDEQVEFVWNQLLIIIEAPLQNFIQKYEKCKSKVLNQRNIRSLIPERYSKMMSDLIERDVDERLLNQIIDCIFEAYSDEITSKNALRFSKIFVKQKQSNFGNNPKYDMYINQKYNVRLLKKLFSDLQNEIKDISRSSLPDFEKKCVNLQKFVACMCKNNLNTSCFEVIDLVKVLDMIRSLDATEERVAKMLNEENIEMLHNVKQQLIIIALLSINRDEFTDEAASKAFLEYILFESKLVGQDLKRLVLLPQDQMQVKQGKQPIQVHYYYRNLRKHSDVLAKFVSETYVSQRSTLRENWQSLQRIFELANSEASTMFSTPDQPNALAEALYKQLITETTLNLEQCLYLKAASPIISDSTTVYSKDIVQKFQNTLISTILNPVDSQKKAEYHKDIWNILVELIQQENGLQMQDRTLSTLSKNQLTLNVRSLIQEVNQQQQGFILGRAQLEKVDRLTRIIHDFTQICDASERQLMVEEIVMNESNFERCDRNCLPLKIFRDLFLQGGISFNVQSMFTEENSGKYTWFASLLLNIENMGSLNNLPGLKKQLLIFIETEIIPALIVSAQNGNVALIMSLIKSFKTIITEENNSCLITLENLIQKMVSPGEEFGFGEEPLLKVDDFKSIFEILSKQKVQELLDKNYDSVSQTDVKLMSTLFNQAAYYILDEPEILNLSKLAKRNLHVDIITKSENMQELCYNLNIYMSLFKHFKTDYDTEMQETLIQWAIGNFTDNFCKSDVDQGQRTYQLNVILEFLAKMMDQFGMKKFVQVISYLPEDTKMLSKQLADKARREEAEEAQRQKEALEAEKKEAQRKEAAAAEEKKTEAPEANEEAEQNAQTAEENKEAGQEQMAEAKEPEHPKEEDQATLETLILEVVKLSNEIDLEPQMYINLLTLIRKVIPDPKIITERQFLIDEIIEMAKNKIQTFNNKLSKIMNQQSDEGSQDEFQIIHKEDEMLQAFADTLMASTQYINEEVNENSLYVLINSGFASLQKAAFFTLHHLYQNFIPKIMFKKDHEDEYKQLQLIAQNQVANAKEQKHGEDEEFKDEQAKDLVEFKNVSEVLVDLIENPPSIQYGQDEGDEEKNSNQLESLIFGEMKEGCLSRKVFGYLLAWSSLLKKIDNGSLKAQLSDRDDYISILGAITDHLEQNRYIYQMLLVIIVAYLPKVKKVGLTQQDLLNFDPALMDIDDLQSSKLMSLYTLTEFMKSFPSLARKYYSNCDKQLLDIVMPYIKQMVNPAILDNEIQKIEISQITLKDNGQGDGLSFSLFKSTKEIIARYTKGEISMQLKIHIPNDYPLKQVQVEVGEQMKITERQKNKWVLAIRNLLQVRNGDIISAVLLWKSNIDKEIDGIEECFICYCVLHPTDKSLPRMPCKNCKNKFHAACIRKWFRTSNKSNCPLCQAFFF